MSLQLASRALLGSAALFGESTFPTARLRFRSYTREGLEINEKWDRFQVRFDNT